jgi:hypothetical protein
VVGVISGLTLGMIANMNSNIQPAPYILLRNHKTYAVKTQLLKLKKPKRLEQDYTKNLSIVLHRIFSLNSPTTVRLGRE